MAKNHRVEYEILPPDGLKRPSSMEYVQLKPEDNKPPMEYVQLAPENDNAGPSSSSVSSTGSRGPKTAGGGSTGPPQSSFASPPARQNSSSSLTNEYVKLPVLLDEASIGEQPTAAAVPATRAAKNLPVAASRNGGASKNVYSVVNLAQSDKYTESGRKIPEVAPPQTRARPSLPTQRKSVSKRAQAQKASALHEHLFNTYHWYHGEVNANDATVLLNNRPVGSFLVRKSSKPGCFTISYVQSDSAIIHVLLSPTGTGRWHMEGVEGDFGNIPEILDKFSHSYVHAVLRQGAADQAEPAVAGRGGPPPPGRPAGPTGLLRSSGGGSAASSPALGPRRGPARAAGGGAIGGRGAPPGSPALGRGGPASGPRRAGPPGTTPGRGSPVVGRGRGGGGRGTTGFRSPANGGSAPGSPLIAGRGGRGRGVGRGAPPSPNRGGGASSSPTGSPVTGRRRPLSGGGGPVPNRGGASSSPTGSPVPGRRRPVSGGGGPLLAAVSSPSSSSSSLLQSSGGGESSSGDELTGRPWFHGEISGVQANKRLQHNQPGTFLVRHSQKTREGCVISFVDSASQFVHVFIERTASGWRAQNTPSLYSNLDSLIEATPALIFPLPNTIK